MISGADVRDAYLDGWLAVVAVGRIAGFNERKRPFILEGSDGVPRHLAALRLLRLRDGRCCKALHPSIPKRRAIWTSSAGSAAPNIPTSSESRAYPMHRPSTTGLTCCGSMFQISPPAARSTNVCGCRLRSMPAVSFRFYAEHTLLLS